MFTHAAPNFGEDMVPGSFDDQMRSSAILAVVLFALSPAPSIAVDRKCGFFEDILDQVFPGEQDSGFDPGYSYCGSRVELSGSSPFF